MSALEPEANEAARLRQRVAELQSQAQVIQLARALLTRSSRQAGRRTLMSKCCE